MPRECSASSEQVLADRHIERCLELIRTQEKCVQYLRNCGLDARASEEQLALLRETVDVMWFHREVMQRRKSADDRGWMERSEVEMFGPRPARSCAQASTVPATEMGTVLLVDDDPNVLGALEAIIAEGGYQVLTAKDGKDALEKARKEPPDLIVSDVMMPVMDGSALVDALASDRRLSDIPIVLHSALATPPPVHVNAFLKKPYSPGQLLDLVRHLIEEHRHRVMKAT
jgi:CheY-like chemotaxis protein